jgi:hypothetical protein
MADIASLSLEVKSDQVKQATIALKEMPPAASAAERAAKKWGTTADAAGRSSEDFSRRVKNTIKSLEFERQQLTRTAAEKQRYAILQRAGVTASSAEGQAILASVTALQAQKAAVECSVVIQKGMATQSTASAGAFAAMTRALGPLLAALSAAAVAQKVWQAGMIMADLDEQAEQTGINAEQLQAWRLVAAQSGVDTEQLSVMFVRLQRAMGDANGGNKEAIDNFAKLGVNILDANGEIRTAADVMPEVARGLLGVSSTTERTSMMMEILGRSGSKAATMLKEFAAGADNAVDKAKGLGAVASPETISAWDALADKLKVAGAVANTLMATLAAPAAAAAARELDNIATSLGRVTNALNNLPKDASIWDRLDALFGGRTGPGIPGLRLPTPQEKAAYDLKQLEEEIAKRRATGRGDTPGTKAMIAKLPAAQAVENSASRDQQIEAERWRLMNEGLPPTESKPGVRNPTAKASGGSDPYKSAIEGAKDYIAAKRAEADAVGQTAIVAARLKHETELLNKASNDNKVLTPQQTAELKSLAGAMADADVAFKSASFMDDAKQRSEDFVASQQMEQQALWMSTQAADALRFSTEMLNNAKRQGIELTPAQIESINQSAQAMAAAKSKTTEMTQMLSLGRDVFKGFFSDMREGAMNGISMWENFGNAGLNALNRISEKLLEMAATKLFDSAFGGSSGGGLFGAILGGAGAGGTSAGIFDGLFTSLMGSPFMAKGGAFRHGNIIPFANGTVVNGPTMFPMAGGKSGVMGEAGPEAIMPLRRGPNGRLGVSMHEGERGQSGGDVFQIKIENTNQFGSVVSRAEMEEQLQIVEERTRKAAIAGVLDAKSRGGAYRTGMRK